MPAAGAAETGAAPAPEGNEKDSSSRGGGVPGAGALRRPAGDLLVGVRRRKDLATVDTHGGESAHLYALRRILSKWQKIR